MDTEKTSRRCAPFPDAPAQLCPGGASFAPPGPLRRARFLRRRNRFVVEIALEPCQAPPCTDRPAPDRLERDGPESWQPEEETSAYLPNPGKLREILLPGTILSVTPGAEGALHPWKVVSASRPAGGTVYLDTGRTNRVAEHLISRGLIPALRGWNILRAEAPLPGTRSRVDFLLRNDAGEERYLEVKSCTLFNGPFAMFPDAVTERGRRHVEELARSGRGALLVVVHSDQCRWFVPEVHTDPAFARALVQARDLLPVIPLGVSWEGPGEIASLRTDMTLPWEAITSHLDDRGCYAILLHLPREQLIPTGALGTVRYPPGWYLYAGSARQGLQARINRHRRRGRKKLHWHIDYLREEASWVEAFPFRGPGLDEATLVEAFLPLADRSIPRFGASDSPCESHLLYFREDPRRSREFVETLLAERRRTLLAAAVEEDAAPVREISPV
ncbi:DNA/RNA nuclease SfsA [Alkalispirochaeta alkalica]|uniref:DNA/RNA nuclease SfsA n=1 Tax=Alkalispirochaeta alkalica TaxID=46356 RepID=UPI0003AA59C7|nr:DNA/RNA nuclease SfsA [Alkalispirochaeta alkalica]